MKEKIIKKIRSDLNKSDYFFEGEIDKVITVVIIQIAPISSGKPKVIFNHKTDKIVADNGSIQYIKRNEYNNLEFAKNLL